jgi:hypothetical protein
MRNTNRRPLRTKTLQLLAVAGLVAAIGCSSKKWEKQPGPYTSGDQPMTSSSTSSHMTAHDPAAGPTSRPYASAAPATGPSAGDSVPATQPAPATSSAAEEARPTPKTPAEETPKPDSTTPPPTPEPKTSNAKPDEKPPAEAAPAEAQVVVGMLSGDVAAIGGETTGWRIVDDKGTAQEVDVSAVRDQAKKLDGKRVRIVGTIITKQYVERGPTKVLAAQRIETAPAAVPAEDNK